MNGWNILLVVFVLVAVVLASMLWIEATALRGELEEARAVIAELKDQVASLIAQVEQLIKENEALKRFIEEQCGLIPPTDGTGSGQLPRSDQTTPGQLPTLWVGLLAAMAVNLAWLVIFVVYRVYANATRDTRRMRLTLEEAEAIRVLREGRA